MMPKPLILLLPGLISMLISACKPFTTVTPPPSPQPVRIAFTPTLHPYVERLHQCALAYPEISIITLETGITDLVTSQVDVTLWFGEPPQGITNYAFSLGSDEIVIIAGEKVKLQNLRTDQLRDLYTSSNPAYQLWTYSKDNELRVIFDRAVFGEAPPSLDAMLAPDPAAMIEAIAMEPNAIGYLPGSWLSGDLQTKSISRDLDDALTHPILALTNSEPQGYLRSYLICLQNDAP